MQIDVDALLAPVSDDSPAGVDLGEHNDRLEIDDIFQSVLRPDFDGDEPNWRDVTRNVIDLLGRSRDLWLAVYLCRAGARLGDLEQVAGGARLLAGMLQQWDLVYPALEDVGVRGRSSRCAELSQRRAFLSALEAIPLVSDPRNGSFALADLEQLVGEGEGSNVGFARLMQADGKAKLGESLAWLEAISEAIGQCDAAFREHGGPEAAGPDFKPLFESLNRMKKAARAFAGVESAAADDQGEGQDGEAGAQIAPAAASAAPVGAIGSIRSREDVVRAMEAICAYYARYEPASPVPLALKRAQAWVTLDFLTVLADIAPDSLSDARRVLMQSESRSEDD